VNGDGAVDHPNGGLRALSVGETLDAAIKSYRSNAISLWSIVVVVIVPLSVLQIVVRRLALPSDVFVHNGALYTINGSGTSGTSGTVALLVTGFIALLAELLATGAVFKLLLEAYLGRAADWRESLAFARHRLLSLLWLGVLTSVLLVIGFLLIIFPGVWLLVASSVAIPVLMLEGVKGFSALKRSLQLVDTRWWATFLRLLAAFLLYVVVAVVLGALVGVLTRALDVTSVTLWVVIDGVLRALTTILLSPFIAAVVTVIYIDLRVRKEALDLELLASRFGAPGTTVPATAA
jgi:hypothetical protein